MKDLGKNIRFRWNNKNSYSIAALLPLIDAGLAREPRPGIMLYSFATAQAEEVYEEISKAKVDAIYIAGGPHPSAMPEEALEFFNYVVIGEGEETLPELIKAITCGENPKNVKGIAYKANSKIVSTGQREPVDLDLYPPFGKILSPIEISRGCPWKCAYCQTSCLFGSKMRHRSIAAIIKYAHRHKDIRLTSPNSLAYGSDGLSPRLDKVESLLSSLSELKRPIYFGTFPSEVRPEFLSHKALELITKYCANKTLSIGAQSGSEHVLRAIGRGHSVGQVEEACDLCVEHCLTPQVDLIFSLPMESPEDQMLTLGLAKRIVGKGGKVRAHYFTPLPGTPLAGTRPSPLAEDVEAELGRLALEGRLTGVWAAKARGRTA
ncbi:MAG: TIGR04013 family B12-binding domain/radical SAM domain-containing protein [Methanotrichaceae archaeon]